MREPERDYGRLQDIIQAADNILSFTEGHTQEQLSSDKLRYFAVVKNVEIIGEAAYMLSLEFKEKHTHIPWDDIIRMRHVLVHGRNHEWRALQNINGKTSHSWIIAAMCVLL